MDARDHGLTRSGVGSPPIRRRAPTTVALLVPRAVRLRVRPDRFEALCQENPDLRLERTARGFLDLMPPASGGAGHRNAGLTAQLFHWARTDGTGLTFDSSTGFMLPNGAVRAPDASWVARSRWDALTSAQKETGFPPLCPDFVVELRSGSDRRSRLVRKLEEYLAQGARLGWLIDPITGAVDVFRAGRQSERLDRPETLSGEDVLPGFVLDLNGIVFD